jgi:UDPglucose 6-dehydrogenase
LERVWCSIRSGLLLRRPELHISRLRAVAKEYDYEPVLLEATVAVNERQKKRLIGKLQRELHTLKGKRIALLGLSFKPNTDDIREAPSL